VEADRPAREIHASPSGLLTVVVEGHGFLQPAKRGMSALLLDTLMREVVGCLPTHDLRGDPRSQTALVRDLSDCLRRAAERSLDAGLAEEGRASAALLFLMDGFFWAARIGAGAILMSRAGFLEMLTAGTGADDEEHPIDVLGAPLEPGDVFLVSSRQVVRALDTEVIGRPLRDLSDNGDGLAAAVRTLGDGANAAGVRDCALVIARSG
jgi:hypothetical protein